MFGHQGTQVPAPDPVGQMFWGGGRRHAIGHDQISCGGLGDDRLGWL